MWAWTVEEVLTAVEYLDVKAEIEHLHSEHARKEAERKAKP